MLFAVGTLWRAVSGGVGSSKVRLETKPLAAAQSEQAQGGWKQEPSHSCPREGLVKSREGEEKGSDS